MYAMPFMFRPHRERVASRSFWLAVWMRVFDTAPSPVDLLNACETAQKGFQFIDTYTEDDPENLEESAVRWHMTAIAHIYAHVACSTAPEIPAAFAAVFHDVFVATRVHAGYVN